MIELTNKACLACKKLLRGRSDKKFCDDYCRNGFNNRMKSKERPLLKEVNVILSKNRKILKSLLPDEARIVKVRKDLLLQRGFRFDYITRWYINKKGSTYYYCYEYGYLPLEGDFYLIVKRKEEMIT